MTLTSQKYGKFPKWEFHLDAISENLRPSAPKIPFHRKGISLLFTILSNHGTYPYGTAHTFPA
jgi:hypothetical protein